MDLLTAIHFLCVLFWGLVLGSFATALIWRVPRGVSWALRPKGGGFPRSACPACHRVLSIQDLVPVFSWALSKGKCRYCAVPVSVRYPLTELATVLGCIGIYLVWGFTVPAVIIMLAVPFLVALLAIDAEHLILPDQLVVLCGVLAGALLLYQLAAYGFAFGFGEQAVSKALAVFIYGGLAWLIRRGAERVLRREALGLGDVKFFAVAGLWLGIGYLPFYLVLSGLLGVVCGAFYKYALGREPFPFGPALILALYACLLLQGLEIVPFVGVQ